MVKLNLFNWTTRFARGALKMALPICVAEHDVGSTVGAALIGPMEEAAKIGLDAQYVEVIPACLVEPDGGCDAIDIQGGLLDVGGDDAVERSVPIAEIAVVGIRIRRAALGPAFDEVEVLPVRQVYRTQDECIEQAEHDRIRSDPHRQCQDGGDGESRRPAQLAGRVAHIGPDRFQRGPLPHFAAALFQHGAVPEGASGGLLGGLLAHAPAHQLLGALLKVEAHLFGEIAINLASPEDNWYQSHGKIPFSSNRHLQAPG